MLRLLALSALLISGCTAPAEIEVEPSGVPASPKPTGSAAERSPDLEDAVQRWEDADLEAYTMTLRRICFCMAPDYTGPFAVTVRGGALDSVVLEGAPVETERALTVEDLFELIEDAYERRAEVVEVEFDETYGYPTNLSIDYSSMMADEEIGYSISMLKPVD